MPNVINFANAFIDHLFDGSHFLRTDFDANGHYFKNPAGIGGADGDKILFCDDAADFQAIVEAAANKTVWVMPGVYVVSVDAKLDPISVPANCTILAYGCEFQFRFTNAGGAWNNRIFNVANKGCSFQGGTYWIDRANSAEAEARRLFYIYNSADPLFLKCTMANSSGREALIITGAGTRAVCVGCQFVPQQNTYTDNSYVTITEGGAVDVPGCAFDGYFPGTSTRRCNGGIGISTQNTRSVIKGATFKHFLSGIAVTQYNWGADQHYVHITNNDFLDNDMAVRLSNVNTGRNLYDLVIENNMMRGGHASYGQIEAIFSTYHSIGFKRLVIRNNHHIAVGAATAKYGIYIPSAGTSPNTTEIMELSGTFGTGFGTSQINIHADIPIGRKSIILES